MRRLTTAIAVLALAATACTPAGEVGSKRIRRDPTPTAAPPQTTPEPMVQAAAQGLQRFVSCDQIVSHLRERALEAVGPYGIQGVGMPMGRGVLMGRTAAVAEGMAADSAASSGAAAPAAAAPAQGVDYSGTNVQEAGVDEPDVVKTDGRRLFVAPSGTAIHALDVTGEPRRVGSLNLNGYGWQLLLSGDRLVAVGYEDAGDVRGMPEPVPGAAVSMMVPTPQRTTVHVIDVSDPAAMQIVSTLRFDGAFVSGREVGGVARLVLHSGGPQIATAYPTDDSETAVREATERNAETVRSLDAEDWLPRYTAERDGERSEGMIAGCEATYRPTEFSGFGTVSVVTLDPRDPAPRAGASVVGAGEHVYASTTGLYVTSTRWTDTPVDPAADSPGPRPDVAVMPTASSTEIHRFDISSADRAVYSSSGSVQGTLLNQFSMSEHEGHLRVATTEGMPGLAPEQGSSESFVTTLAERDGKLTEVGRVGGMGRGERIYSVRFLGDVGYVVTFRQVDPLYTLDLRDPASPRVVGELKIPGFSAYLHPVGEGRILGVGQNATEQGQVTGTQVSLFDVRDPADPKRLATYEMPGGHSEAEYDHHAFLWWEARRLAVLPVGSWAPDGSHFQGALALRVEDAITEAGRLAHDRAGVVPIRRSLVVGDLLLTVSDAGVEAADLGSFADRAWVPFV